MKNNTPRSNKHNSVSRDGKQTIFLFVSVYMCVLFDLCILKTGSGVGGRSHEEYIKARQDNYYKNVKLPDKVMIVYIFGGGSRH